MEILICVYFLLFINKVNKNENQTKTKKKPKIKTKKVV